MEATEAGLFEIAFPFDLAAELADTGLALNSDEHFEGRIYGLAFGFGAEPAHGLGEELVVNLNVGPHGARLSVMCKQCDV